MLPRGAGRQPAFSLIGFPSRRSACALWIWAKIGLYFAESSLESKSWSHVWKYTVSIGFNRKNRKKAWYLRHLFALLRENRLKTSLVLNNSYSEKPWYLPTCATTRNSNKSGQEAGCYERVERGPRAGSSNTALLFASITCLSAAIYISRYI